MQVRDGRDFSNYFVTLENIHRFYIGGEVRKSGKMALLRTGRFLADFCGVF
jgi:hypothetical protein